MPSHTAQSARVRRASFAQTETTDPPLATAPDSAPEPSFTTHFLGTSQTALHELQSSARRGLEDNLRDGVAQLRGAHTTFRAVAFHAGGLGQNDRQAGALRVVSAIEDLLRTVEGLAR